MLKQVGITLKGISYDIAIASYILNPTNNKLKIEDLAQAYLEIDLNMYKEDKEEANKQINLFDDVQEEETEDTKKICTMNACVISE